MKDEQSINPSLQKIMDIAENLILEKGCRAATLQEIAEKSGMTKGAIYHYVKGKDELFAMILESRLERSNQEFYESVAKSTTGIHGPVQLIAKNLHHLSQKNSVSNLIFIYLLSQIDKPKINKILNRLYETSLETSSKWIEVGKKDKVIPDNTNAEKTANFLSALKYGLQVQSILSSNTIELDSEDLYEFLLKTLETQL